MVVVVALDKKVNTGVAVAEVEVEEVEVVEVEVVVDGRVVVVREVGCFPGIGGQLWVK